MKEKIISPKRTQNAPEKKLPGMQKSVHVPLVAQRPSTYKNKNNTLLFTDNKNVVIIILNSSLTTMRRAETKITKE